MADSTVTPILSVCTTVGSKVSDVEIKDGQLIFIRDKREIALDYDGKRVFYNQIIELATESARTSILAPVAGSYYFVIDPGVLWTYQTEWIQITTPPGSESSSITPLDAYPVGSLYMSVNSTSPASLFGGTWEQLKDRFLLGAGSSYTNGSTGGAASVSYTPKGTNAGTAITIAQMPSHSHTATVKVKISSNSNTGGYSTDQVAPGKTGSTIYNRTDPMTASNANTGGGQTHTHTFTGTAATIATMPPYLVVYMWKRTA